MTHVVPQQKMTGARAGNTRSGRATFLALAVLGILLCTAQARSAKAPATAKSSTTAKGAAKSGPKHPTAAATEVKSTPAPSPAAPAPPLPAAPVAPRYAPFSEFAVLAPGELLSLRFKLTRLGGADPANAVAVWGVKGQVADPGDFIPYRRPGFQYEPANSMPFNFTVEAAEMQAVVDSVGAISQVVHGAAESRGVLSFAMLATVGGRPHAFEVILGPEGSRLLMGRILGALAANVSAVNSLRRFGCAGELLPESAPIIADSLVKITMTTIRADKASPGEFMSSAVITNISSGPIAGPLTLVIQVDPDTRVIGAEGETCHVQPAGAPFISLAGSSLAPGEVVRQTLKFWNQTSNKFDATLMLVAGDGTR
jgi:hypothetical protein